MADLELLSAKIDPSKVESGARDIATAFNNLNKKVEKSTKEIENDFSGMEKAVSNSLKRLGGTIAAFLSARELVEATTRWTNYTNALRVVTEDGQSLVNTQEDILDLANRTRQSIDTVGPSFQRLSIASESLNLTQEETVRNLETINKLAAAGGGPQESMAAGVYQLNQALGSGVLAGDEFRSVMENLPIFARELGKELGVTTGELRQLSKEQKLTSDVVITAIDNMADSADELFSKVNTTLPQGFTVFTNSLTAFIGRADEAAGVSNFFGRTLEYLGNVLADLGKLVFGTQSEVLNFSDAMRSVDPEFIAKQIENYNAILEQNSTLMEVYTTNIEDLNEQYSSAQEEINQVTQETNGLMTEIASLSAITRDYEGELKTQKTLLEETTKESTAYAAAVDTLTKRLEYLKERSKPPILAPTPKEIKETEKRLNDYVRQMEQVDKDLVAMRQGLTDELIQQNENAYDQMIKDANDTRAEEQKAMEQHVERLTDIVGAGFKSLFVDIFDGALDDFDSFAEAMQRSFVNMLAEMAWQAAQNKILIPVETGTVSGAGGGGVAGVGQGFGSPLIGSVAGASIGFGRGGLGGALGGGLGGAAGVIAAGSEAVVTAITGISSALGAAVPVLLPLAGILGGSFLGGLFGGGGGGGRDPARGPNYVQFSGGFGETSVVAPNVAARSQMPAFEAVSRGLNELDRSLQDILSAESLVRVTEQLEGFRSFQQVPEFSAEEVITKRAERIVKALDSSLLPLFKELSEGLDSGRLAELTATFAAIFQTFEDGITIFSDIGSPGQLIEVLDEFANTGESLTDTLTRLVTGLGLVREVVDSLGNTLSDVQFADTLIDALGGLDNAAQAISTFRQTFYTETELLTDAVDTARENAQTAFDDISLAFRDTLTSEEFRAAFDAVRNSLSAEDLADWIQAGNALATLNNSIEALNTATADLNDTVQDTTDTVQESDRELEQQLERWQRLEDFMKPFNREIENFELGLEGVDLAIVNVERKFDDLVLRAEELGASEDQIAELRRLEAFEIDNLRQAEARRIQELANNEEELRNRQMQQQAEAYQISLQAFRRAVEEIEEIISNVTDNLGDLRREIEIALLPEENRNQARYEDLQREANALADTISALTDAEEIARVTAEVENLTRQAFGLLDEQQRQAVGQQFLNFIDEVQQLSQTRLREIRDEVLQRGVEDPFAKSSVQMLKASNEMVSAAIGMRVSSETLNKAATNLERTLSRGIRVRVETNSGAVVNA